MRQQGNNAVSLNLDSPKLADGEVETKFKYTLWEAVERV